MSDEIFQLGNQLLSSLIDIWRRKCSDKSKVKTLNKISVD